MSFRQHLTVLEANFRDHPNREITRRVLECLDYIEANIDYVASQVGKSNLLRHPTNHLAFHLKDFKQPEEAKNSFQLLIAEVKGCLEQLAKITDPDIRQAVTHSFLFNINDDAVGCMEARLRPALKFFALYQSRGCFSIDDLMGQFYTACQGQYSVRAALDFFAEQVEHQLPVKDVDGSIKPLSWQMIKDYMQETLAIDIEQDWKKYGKQEQPLVVEVRRWQHYYFADEQAAKRYLSYVKSLLPDFSVELAKAEVKYEGLNNQYTFRLTHRQHDQFLKQSKPEITISPFKDRDVLVKSIRWDNNCFIAECVDGITPDPAKEKSDLRHAAHRPWTVNGRGVFKRDKKQSPYDIADKEVLKRKKAERSPPQSTSLVTPAAQIPVFGHNRERKEKLVGFVFDIKDALLNRLFKYDGGTVDRPYEFLSEKEAKQYYDEKVASLEPMLFADYEKYKQAIAQETEKYNEVLARIRWLEGSSAVGIFSDNFESRCVAQYYARIVRQKLKKPADHPVPIVYYLPGDAKNWHYYTPEAQQQDRQQAKEIFRDPAKLSEAVESNNLEFLLLLDDPLSVLSYEVKGKSLFDWMQKKNEPQLIYALLSSYMNENVGDNKKLLLDIPKLSQSTLNYFMEHGDKQVVMYGIKNGLFELDQQDAEGHTLLHYACKRRWTDVVKLLLERACDPNAHRDADVVETIINNKLLLAAAIGVSIPLAAASMGSTLAGVWYVMQRNPSYRALVLCLSGGHIPFDPLDHTGNTPLILAAVAGDLEAVNALLTDERSDPTIQNIRGYNALMVAAIMGHAEIVKRLLDDGRIDPNIENREGNSALALAILYQQRETVKILLADKRIQPTYQLIELAALSRERDLFCQIAAAVVKNYIDVLSSRTTEYQPRVACLATLFANAGFSKTLKLQAANKLLRIINGEKDGEHPISMSEEEKAALHNGRLWKIVESLGKHMDSNAKRTVGLVS